MNTTIENIRAICAKKLCMVLYHNTETVFIGAYEDCVDFIRAQGHNWGHFDLRYVKDGKPWRMASFVL